MEEIEIDSQNGQRALLYLRTPDGRDWVAAAVLSEMTPVGGGGGRPIEAGEDVRLVTFTLVIE